MTNEALSVLEGFPAGEGVYDLILREFGRERVNMKRVAFLMAALAKEKDGNVARNGFLMLDGLLHEDRGLFLPGRDIQSLGKKERHARVMDIMDFVEELSYF